MTQLTVAVVTFCLNDDLRLWRVVTSHRAAGDRLCSSWCVQVQLLGRDTGDVRFFEWFGCWFVGLDPDGAVFSLKPQVMSLESVVFFE